MTASVDVAETSPSATLVIFLLRVAEPTDTSLEDDTAELFPSATEFVIPAPILTLFPSIWLLSEPAAILLKEPIAQELFPSIL